MFFPQTVSSSRNVGAPIAGQPSTYDVAKANVQEAFYGLGTMSASDVAGDIREARKSGNNITLDEWKQSEYYRSDVNYDASFTKESAEIIAKQHDETMARAKIIAEASTGQQAIGLAVGFAAGVIEPRNLGYGVTTSLALSPFFAASNAVSSARRLFRLKRTASEYAILAKRGAAEGFVSAAAMEPGNRNTAETLKQDYTMADTMFNVATSAVLGAGLETAPRYLRDRFFRNPVETPHVARAELDLAQEQLVRGQSVDVSSVERASAGKIADKPLPERAAAAERFVQYTDTPEFKARFPDNVSQEVRNANGTPMMLYHGTSDEILGGFDLSHGNRLDSGWLGEGVYLTDSPHMADIYSYNKQKTGGAGRNIMPLYAALEKPLVLTQPEGNRIKQRLRKEGKDAAKAYTDKLKSDGYDGIIMTVASDAREILVFDPNKVISAFGADDLSTIAARLDAEHAAMAKNAIAASLDPVNDTALNHAGIKDAEARAIAAEISAEQQYTALKEQIDAMAAEGILTDADLREFNDAISAISEEDFTDGLSATLNCMTRG